ncbi:MAG: gamma-glutamyl-gamma-aminobutyrate hydrolase family protein [Xanthomonadaceae bacterium]|nr:gamma-glutamyl-gamma-aminobutyrate hydrolase family protein [Xanthomonadaceae bacterium]
MAQPVIAVTGPSRGALGPRTCVSVAVRLYGAHPLQLGPGTDLTRHRYDGVVVTGGHDIDPVLYAAEPEVEPRHDKARDAFETRVINNALERGLPLLGICRGAQLLNVCRGGSLFQDLRPQRRRTSHRRTVLPLKTLCINEADSLLAEVMGAGNARINSLHNQAIDRVGSGLRVVARDLDSIVQAVEDREYGFLMGVQWHPEFLIFIRRQLHLFRALVRAAESRAG